MLEAGVGRNDGQGHLPARSIHSHEPSQSHAAAASQQAPVPQLGVPLQQLFNDQGWHKSVKSSISADGRQADKGWGCVGRGCTGHATFHVTPCQQQQALTRSAHTCGPLHHIESQSLPELDAGKGPPRPVRQANRLVQGQPQDRLGRRGQAQRLATLALRLSRDCAR